jgi:hypothetical protein
MLYWSRSTISSARSDARGAMSARHDPEEARVHEVFWLISDRLAGRPGPERAPWNLENMRNAGVRAVLSVNDGILCRPADFAALGIRYACIPLSPNAPPRPGDDERCLQALPEAYAYVRDQLAQDRLTVVHCSGGKDRTGLYLAYHWMQHAGVSAESAVQEVVRIRPIAFTACGWSDFALGVLRRC